MNFKKKAENIVYCNYLEHLILHIKICYYPRPIYPHMDVGIGGVINFLVPELNDLYSGFITKQQWRKNCYNLVIDDKELYLTILKNFIHSNYFREKRLIKECLLRSYNKQYNLWTDAYNRDIYYEIKCL